MAFIFQNVVFFPYSLIWSSKIWRSSKFHSVWKQVYNFSDCFRFVPMRFLELNLWIFWFQVIDLHDVFTPDQEAPASSRRVSIYLICMHAAYRAGSWPSGASPLREKWLHTMWTGLFRVFFGSLDHIKVTRELLCLRDRGKVLKITLQRNTIHKLVVFQRRN